MPFKQLIAKYSENIAGCVSLLGSSSLILAGNIHSILAAAIFTVSEVTLGRIGHRTAGYSSAAALFAVGDLSLAFSGAVETGSTLQVTLLGMTAAWTAGALKYPFEKAAEALDSKTLQHVADSLPVICGTANLALRLPGIFSAAAAGNYILVGAISAWGAADILAGRLQERISHIIKYVQS